MGLYLCVFDGDEELDGVEVGGYDDFDFFRSAVTELLENGNLGSKFPTLCEHSNCDGQWSVEECVHLAQELKSIANVFVGMPRLPLDGGWQAELTKSNGQTPNNLYECFIDVDGSPLIDRLWRLCSLAMESGQPILFQ